MHLDTVVFVSNPFGLGPAGKAVTLISALRKRWDGRIVYIASEKCLAIVPHELSTQIEIVPMDERDENGLRATLSRYPTAMVMVVLNKAAIRVAHELGNTTAFVDSLSWMWKEIPEEYLSADRYYYYNIFGEQARLQGVSNAQPLSPILGALPERKMVAGTYFLHIGGFSNPFATDNHGYLELLARLVSRMDATCRLTIAGGKTGIQFLAEQIGPQKNVACVSLDRDAFLHTLAGAERFITTSGSTAVFEAFAMGTPTTFLLPTNLSQWKQLNLLTQFNAAPVKMQWGEYAPVRSDLDTLSEPDALQEFLSLPANIRPKAQSSLENAFRDLFFKETDFSGQRAFIQTAGEDGASAIVSDMLKVVRSAGN